MTTVQMRERQPRPIRWRSHTQPVSVLALGNNPTELGQIQDVFAIMRDATYVVDFAFDRKDAMKRAQKIAPHIILIDHTFEQDSLRELVLQFANHKKFGGIPRLLVLSDAEPLPGDLPIDVIPMAQLKPIQLGKWCEGALQKYSQAG